MVENVSPREAWQALQDDPSARLVDVRTDIEWVNIGVPDGEPALISWQVAPSMQVNERFVAELEAAGVKPGDKLYLLCRSGVRSMAAGQAAEAAGLGPAFNIVDGFEGPPDGSGMRGRVAGWQADGLPWSGPGGKSASR